jgi:hypothetical protein
MIRIVVTPQTKENFYAKLVTREKTLQTFYRSGPRKPGQRKWKHVKYQGWMNLQKTFGGITVACIQAKNPDEEWKILSAFIGMLDRYFRDTVSNININYETGE